MAEQSETRVVLHLEQEGKRLLMERHCIDLEVEGAVIYM